MSPDLLLLLQLWSGNTESSPEERTRLLQRLQDDPAFRTECAEELHFLGLLQTLQSPPPRWLALGDTLQIHSPHPAPLSSADFQESVMRKILTLPEGSSARTTHPPRRTLLLALAAGLVFLLGMAALEWRRPANATEFASVTESTAGAWNAGERLARQRLTWIRGSLTLRLSSGVMLNIQGPADLELLNPMEVRLLAGKITADIGEHGKGFVIDTPETRVVDLGTVFGVDASSVTKTDVVVFKGQVEVFEKGHSAPGILLNQGEGLRVEKNRRSSRIVGITESNESNASHTWSVQESPAEPPLIQAVSDSLKTDDEGAKRWTTLRSFYRIVPGGLREGALAFSDCSDVWRNIPARVLGADQVRTFAVDSHNWWMNLTIELRRPCELFVFIDQRNTVPQWVLRDFTDSGETLTLDQTSSWAPGRAPQPIAYSVWQRTVEKPGAVTLGPPYEDALPDPKNFRPNRMFGVAAKPLN
ncbi:MAG: hypothetical protein RLZZ399_2618 [Verrucomicrobiota bacterium]